MRERLPPSTRSAVEPIVLPTARSRFDPPEELSRLRERSPISPLRFTDARPGWLVTSYRLARIVLTDPRFGVDRSAGQPAGMTDPESAAARDEVVRRTGSEYAPEVSGDMLAQDPPQHTRLRRLHAPHFTTRRTSEHRERVERIVAEQLELMERADRPVDLCAEFAEPVALRVACELLYGVAPGDRERLRRLINIKASPDARPDVLAAATQELWEFGRALIEQKRVRPGDDVLSELEVTGELSNHELSGVANMMLRAGHYDMGRLLALGTLVLLAHRERWEMLQTQPAAMPGAVEELLRYCTVFHLSQRVALEDLELDGTVIEAGDTIVVSLAAANRDPEKFPDPDGCDLSRDASGQLAFAHGRHICLGQHLVRLEFHAGLEGLIRRFPDLRLAGPIDQIQMYGGNDSVYGVKALPVTW